MKLFYHIVAQNLLEYRRDKVFHLLAALLLGYLIVCQVVSDLALSEQSYVILSLGQLGLEICGIFVVLMGSLSLHQGIKRKIVLSLLAKPMSRSQFLLGRWFALLILVAILLGLGWAICQGLLLNLGLNQKHLLNPLAILPLFAELAMLSALANLCAVLTSPGLSIFFVLGFWVVGKMSSDLVQQSALSAQISGADHGMLQISQLIYGIFPDLSKFDLSSAMLQNLPLSGSLLWSPVAVGLGFALFWIGLALWAFEKKDFS